MAYLFTAGTARGGTGVYTNILNTHNNVKIAQDPFLAFWKSYRDNVVLKSQIEQFTPGSPLGEYYFIENELLIMDAIMESNLNVPFDCKGGIERLRDDIGSRIYLSSGTLKNKLSYLKGNTYKEILDSALNIVDLGIPGPSSKWLGFNENWCIEFFNTLSKSYPDSKYIIYVRDVRAAIASHLKLFKKNPDFKGAIALVLSFARGWRKHIAYAIKYSSLSCFKNRMVCIRYEDLINSTEFQVQNLCKFLNIDYSDYMINTENFISTDGGKWLPNSNHEDTPCSGIYKDSLYKWEKSLDGSILELIEYVCGPELDLLGYKLKNNKGKEFPSKAFQFHFKDNVECLGWRTDSKDPLREFAYECLRRNLLFSKIKDQEVIRACFLFPEVYDQLLNKKLSINTFSNFDLI